MSFLTYLWYKFLAVLIRAFVSRGKSIPSNPDDVWLIQSRDTGRSIKAHVYRSAASTLSPTPVLINFHGSGFVIPAHGSDDQFCRLVSRQTEYTVLDVQYRLAPEHPFPAALNDVEDAVRWVLARPGQFDSTRVVISGFSAGGNLALAASSSIFRQDSQETLYPLRAVLAFYPVVDLSTDPGSKAAPDSSGRPIPATVARIFDRCYIPSSFDTRDPRISPAYADSEGFPDRVLIVTAACDTLAPEAEALAARIDKSGRKVVSQRMAGCVHAWDKQARPGTQQSEARDRAYSLAMETMGNKSK